VNAEHRLDARHKFVYELGWRAYYRHVWSHQGENIHRSLHAGPLPDDAYQTEIPTDILEARTGVAAIDQAIRELYVTGYVHNHARMWLASYLVHLRKVHWHAGAQWMIGCLLDGDLASNHLSWQWVAGTGSSKPYLFNAENVAKYAPTPWHCSGTSIDTSYEELDEIARSRAAINTRPDIHRAAEGIPQPELSVSPPMSAPKAGFPETRHTPASPSTWHTPDAADSSLKGRDVWLHHPWSIGTPSRGISNDTVHIGIGLAAAHAATPWSQQRWDFVTRGLQANTSRLWWGSAEQLAHALQLARSVRWHPDPHIDIEVSRLQTCLQSPGPHPNVGAVVIPDLFEPVDTYCRSFSQWWGRTGIVPEP
jgi:deoxyribodipyrimidine photo-lyase